MRLISLGNLFFMRILFAWFFPLLVSCSGGDSSGIKREGNA